MNITIDEVAMRAATEQAAQKAIIGALDSYDVAKLLRERACEAVLSSALATAVETAIGQADIQLIANEISKELVRVVGSLAIRSLREAAVTTIIATQNRGYMSESALSAERSKILASIEARK